MAGSIVRAVAYYRMSDDSQEHSIERQRSQVVPYAERHGYQYLGEYIDEGISGFYVKKRPQFQRMLKDAEAGKFDVILVDDLDRFGRLDSIDFGELVAPLRRQGIMLVTAASGPLDWNTMAGRFMATAKSETADAEHQQISRRVLTRHLLKARNGIDTGSRPLYGYNRVADAERGKRLEPDETTARVVRLMFEMYDRGATLSGIAEELFRRGVPSPRGGPRWRRTVIQRVLTNQRYLGDFTWGVQPSGKRFRFAKSADGGISTTERGCKTGRTAPAGNWIIVPNTHGPLIDRETFARVQARLEGNRSLTTPHAGGGDFVLSKLLVCGHCGNYLVGMTRKRAAGRTRVYICGGYWTHGKSVCCNHWIPEGAMIRAIVRKLQAAFLDKANLKALREEAAALDAERNSDGHRKRLTRRIAKLAADIDRGHGNLAILPPDVVPGVVAKIRQWDEEKRTAEDELRRAEAESKRDDLEQVIKDTEALLWRLQDALKAEDVPLLREALRATVAKVECRWTHRQAGNTTRTRFAGAVLTPRLDSGESQMLSPSCRRWLQLLTISPEDLDAA